MQRKDINEKNFKEYLKTNPKEMKTIIYDCYTDYPDNTNKIIDYCITSNILKRNNYSNVKKADISGCTKEYNDCNISKDYCKGHQSNYGAESCLLCDDCQKWISSCAGFYHCCCYIYDDNTYLED